MGPFWLARTCKYIGEFLYKMWAFRLFLANSAKSAPRAGKLGVFGVEAPFGLLNLVSSSHLRCSIGRALPSGFRCSSPSGLLPCSAGGAFSHSLRSFDTALAPHWVMNWAHVWGQGQPKAEFWPPTGKSGRSR